MDNPTLTPAQRKVRDMPWRLLAKLQYYRTLDEMAQNSGEPLDSPGRVKISISALRAVVAAAEAWHTEEAKTKGVV